MSASLNQLIPPLRPYARALVDLAGRAGIQPRITSTRRSHNEQARLYRSYLAGANPYPVAPPGTSAHEYGYAFDMVVTPMDSDNLADLGKIWKDWGGIWGGEFNDPIHFEYPGFKQPATHPAAVRGEQISDLGDNIWDWTLNVLDPVGATSKYDVGAAGLNWLHEHGLFRK